MRHEFPGLAGPQSTASDGGRLGTFAGVFTPSILTIFGITLFLPPGFVVGEAGLMRTPGVIAVANGIALGVVAWVGADLATRFQ